MASRYDAIGQHRPVGRAASAPTAAMPEAGCRFEWTGQPSRQRTHAARHAPSPRIGPSHSLLEAAAQMPMAMTPGRPRARDQHSALACERFIDDMMRARQAPPVFASASIGLPMRGFMAFSRLSASDSAASYHAISLFIQPTLHIGAIFRDRMRARPMGCDDDAISFSDDFARA